MTVKEVKDLLNALPPSFDYCNCIVQKDAEGNAYSPLSGIDVNAIYIPDSTYSGEGYDRGWTAEDVGISADEWESLKESEPNSVIFYPIN